MRSVDRPSMSEPLPNLSEIRALLKAAAKPGNVPILQRFFKTGKGEYSEGMSSLE
jgi:hypothetical protein